MYQSKQLICCLIVISPLISRIGPLVEAFLSASACIGSAFKLSVIEGISHVQKFTHKSNLQTYIYKFLRVIVRLWRESLKLQRKKI